MGWGVRAAAGRTEAEVGIGMNPGRADGPGPRGRGRRMCLHGPSKAAWISSHGPMLSPVAHVGKRGLREGVVLVQAWN